MSFRVEELAPGVYARIGSRPLEPNSAFIVDDDGVTLIDTAYSPAAARAIATDIARVTPKPVTTVIISHHHFDHAWGNQVFAGARIIGHANARTAMHTDRNHQVAAIQAFAPTAGPWYGLSVEAFQAEIAEVRLTPPTATFTQGMTLWPGGREMRLLHLGPGHTFGDTLVYLPAERVLVGGDVICNRLIPVVGDGDPFHFAHVLDQIEAMDVGVIVPGHGELCGTAEVRAFASCLDHLCAEVHAARAAGAPDPRTAFRRVHLGDFAGWSGHEMLPASVRRIYRALEGPRAPSPAAPGTLGELAREANTSGASRSQHTEGAATV